MWWHAHEGMGWWMLFGGILWLVFLGTILYFIAYALGGTRTSRRGDEDDALEIAKRRYARGDITREEFEQIRRDLTGRSSSGPG
ncbi:MAG: SHOCT domain-containing protein [Dehalococcoidia bacterium]|nr:SHOCT domain-containing protein [Dehalococcoidia bacterium]